MHYTGTIWRPPYEAASLLIEVTAGCTHHKCKFCTLYNDLPFKFKMSPLEDIECDLQELKKATKGWSKGRIDRVFLTGANPFVLSYDKLAVIAELIHNYLPSVKSIGSFARITDITPKTDEELTKLRALGYDGLTIGIETGDDEAHSVIIQATSDCTYNKCKFCSLYKNECFRISPMEEFEEDLAEIKGYQPYARRIFWTGATPFAMSYENLKLRALTVRDYLIKCQTMAMFASIRDIKNKEVWQLRKLRAMGINGLSIGVESGDDETLALANKGYTTADILEQCRKLDEAGIEYYFVYMTGLAGKEGGCKNARNSAKLFSQLNPYFVSVDSLTLFPDTELYKIAQQGLFMPAEEKERIRELQILINNLNIRTHLFANTVSNFTPITAYLPYDREKVTSELQYVLDNVDEIEMQEYRKNLK